MTPWSGKPSKTSNGKKATTPRPSKRNGWRIHSKYKARRKRSKNIPSNSILVALIALIFLALSNQEVFSINFLKEQFNEIISKAPSRLPDSLTISTPSGVAVINDKVRNSYVRTIEGLASDTNVVDADTMDIKDTRVRFSGISADEKGSPTYNSCKATLRKIISNSSEVICYMSGKKTYNREVGDCFIIRDGTLLDIQRLVVESGCARDCTNFSGGHYKKFETTESKKLDFPNYCR